MARYRSKIEKPQLWVNFDIIMLIMRKRDFFIWYLTGIFRIPSESWESLVILGILSESSESQIQQSLNRVFKIHSESSESH